MRVLWAYHPEDPVGGRVVYHGHLRRGTRYVNQREREREKKTDRQTDRQT